MIEKHPIPEGFIPDNCKSLVIGTFPPRKEHEGNPQFFFYNSPQNHFWNRMENIFPNWGGKLKVTKSRLLKYEHNYFLENKKDFCQQYGVGFLDVFQEITRKQDSSKDIHIIPKLDIVESKELLKKIDTHPNLESLCCTYKLAFEHLKVSILRNENELHLIEHKENLCHINFRGRTIKMHKLFAATRSRETKEQKDIQYKNLIFDI